MRENAVSILKQRRLVTLGGMIDFHIQQRRRYHTSRFTTSRDNHKVNGINPEERLHARRCYCVFIVRIARRARARVRLGLGLGLGAIRNKDAIT